MEKQKFHGPLFRKISYWIKHGYLRICVFGPGGVGKSYLGYLLENGDIKPELFSKPYEESLYPEDRKLGGPMGGIWGKVIIPPGQERRAETFWPDLYEILSNGKSAGIINVVSWGYHSVEDDGFTYKETKYYKSGMSVPKFMEAYTSERKQKELDALEEIVPRIIDADKTKRIWMITLVTKQDLWWNERNDVKDFYMAKRYNSYIEQIAQSRGRQYFVHEYLSASLLLRNFTIAGEVLASTTPGYDQSIQYAHVNRLLDTIENFANL